MCWVCTPYTPITHHLVHTSQHMQGLHYTPLCLQNEFTKRVMPSSNPRHSLSTGDMLIRPRPSADDMLFNPAFDDGGDTKDTREDLHSMLEQMKTYHRPLSAELSLPDMKDGLFQPPQTPIMPSPGKPFPKRAKLRLKNVARYLKPKPVARPPRYLSHGLRRSSSV